MMVYTTTRFKHGKKKRKVKGPVAKKLTKAQLAKLCANDTTSLPSYKRYDRSIPSLSTHAGNTNRKDIPKYTGERKLLGVAAMHKSNLVPIFADNQEAAVEVARMRRN